MPDSDFTFLKDILTSQQTSNSFPLIYKGELTHQVTKVFTSMAEQKIKTSDNPPSVARRVYHVMVECLQNITKHSDEYDDENNQIGNGLFIIEEETESFYVLTGNKIQNEKVASLRERIDYLNGLDKEELNTQFKKQMKEGKISAKGGAGLGLIDIVRKTERPLEYQFTLIDDKYSFFLLKVTIPTN